MSALDLPAAPDYGVVHGFHRSLYWKLVLAAVQHLAAKELIPLDGRFLANFFAMSGPRHIRTVLRALAREVPAVSAALKRRSPATEAAGRRDGLPVPGGATPGRGFGKKEER